MAKLQYDRDDAELKNQKANIQIQKVEANQAWNYYLFIVYYILAFIAIIVMYMRHPYSLAIKHIIAIFFILYPFIIYYIEIFFYNYYKYIMSFVYGIPYEK